MFYPNQFVRQIIKFMFSLDISSDDNSARRETAKLLTYDETKEYKPLVHKLIQFHAFSLKT